MMLLRVCNEVLLRTRVGNGARVSKSKLSKFRKGSGAHAVQGTIYGQRVTFTAPVYLTPASAEVTG